jgi:hypothetical protein
MRGAAGNQQAGRRYGSSDEQVTQMRLRHTGTFQLADKFYAEA